MPPGTKGDGRNWFGLIFSLGATSTARYYPCRRRFIVNWKLKNKLPDHRYSHFIFRNCILKSYLHMFTIQVKCQTYVSNTLEQILVYCYWIDVFYDCFTQPSLVIPRSIIPRFCIQRETVEHMLNPQQTPHSSPPGRAMGCLLLVCWKRSIVQRN